MIKYLYNLLNNKVSDLRIRKVINYEDKNTKIAENKDKDLIDLKKNGYLFIENFFTEEQINVFKNKISYSKEKRNAKISNFMITNSSLPDILISNQRLNLLLKNYLGDDVKLDFFEVNKLSLNPEVEIISEKWHYDIVGKRIKIFAFLNDCQKVFTEYVAGTNNIKHKNYTTVSSRRSDKYIRSKYKDFFKAVPKKGSIFIFDTNGFHRGSYRDSINLSTKNSRESIQFEFSSKSKSDKINNIGIDQIGVRDIFFSKDYDFNNKLICKEYLSKVDNSELYFYDRNLSLF